MPVDANIALGVRPVEPVNMLGQMGQMMQLRQANDEYESNNALKDFYAQGGDLSRPEDQRRLMSTVGAKGADLIAKQFALQKTKEEVKKLGYDNVESEFKQSRGLLSSIDPDSPNAGAQLMAWHEANHRSPIMGSILAASGIDAASSRATLQASINRGPAGIREAIRRSSLGQADYQKELMQTERSVIAAGPANRRLDYDMANPPQHFFTGPDGTLMVAPQKGAGGARPVPMAGGSTAAPAPQISIGGGGGATPMGGGSSIMVNPAPVNALAPSAPINQNALITQPQPTPAPAAPTFAQVRAVPVTKDIVDPTDPSGRRMITVEVNTYKAGTGLGVDGNQAAPVGVLGVATSQIPAGYMRDPNNPQGVIPVPGNAATDPKAAALLRGPRAGYKYNDAGEEVRIPQTGVPEGVRIKPGERWSEEKQMIEQIPGSSAFIEQQKKHGADLNAVKTAQTSTKWGTGRIDKILAPENKKGFENNFGGFTAYGTKEFSGNTALVKTEIDSLKSDLKNRGLQIIRSGGSIGAITEKEWPIIESMIATLSPKMEVKDARDVLNEVRAKFEALENLAAEKYNDQWQGTQYHKPVSTTRTTPASGGGGGGVDATNKFLQ